MILAEISFGSFIVLIWVFIFFIGPIIKAVKANKNKKDAIPPFIPPTIPTTTERSTPVNHRIDTRTQPTENRELTTQSIPEAKSLRTILKEIRESKANERAMHSAERKDNPPSLPEEGKGPRVKRVSKASQKLELLKVDDSNDMAHVGIKSRYAIKSTKELKKAFVWSEILNRKYN